MNFIGIIPARYASSRFPGKPLALISGKPMIQHVYENASKVSSLDKIIVATDDQRILESVKSFGGMAIITRNDHKSGTDRCNEALQTLKKENLFYDVAINIQGDEPFLNPEQIELVVNSFKDNPKTKISTLIKKIDQSEELFNSNVVKVVVDDSGNAVYFSRLPIPSLRDFDQKEWVDNHVYYKHIGIYGFISEDLEHITNLQQSKLEIAESLEQLRWIENGYQIKTRLTDIENLAVDTPDDLKKITNNI